MNRHGHIEARVATAVGEMREPIPMRTAAPRGQVNHSAMVRLGAPLAQRNPLFENDASGRVLPRLTRP